MRSTDSENKQKDLNIEVNIVKSSELDGRRREEKRREGRGRGAEL